MTEDVFYFEHGLTPGVALAGGENRNLRLLEEVFGVRLVARDNWIRIVGEEARAARVRAAFVDLTKLYVQRRRQLDQRDFELVLRAYRDGFENNLAKLCASGIPVSSKRREILPRSGAQMEYIAAMRACDVVFGIGPAGTGKTYLAMAMAVSELLKGNFARIILTRPAREAGEALGFLPGTLEDKVMPYLRPLYDALYDMLDHDELAKLLERNVIEIAPLAFMRGRTLSCSFIILDEAQNTTSEQMLMFLTRMGYHSRCVITGDPMQSDLGPREKSGLKQAQDTLRGIPGIQFCEFGARDVVRHALLEKIINAYNRNPEVQHG